MAHRVSTITVVLDASVEPVVELGTTHLATYVDGNGFDLVFHHNKTTPQQAAAWCHALGDAITNAWEERKAEVA